MSPDICPTCGLPVRVILDFRAHVQTVAANFACTQLQADGSA